MLLLLILVFSCIFWFSLNAFKNSVQDKRYPERRCPYCGTIVHGRKGYTAINDNSFVNYTCTNCGATNNKSSNIWYRKRLLPNGDYDYEMKS